jgi:hypothetical protein
MARESIFLAPIGAGSGSSWAWVGKSFSVSGSGSRSANIRMEGHLHGVTMSVMGGAGSTDIKFVVKDATTGTSYTNSIYSSSGDIGTVVDQYFNNGVSVTLKGGHYYKAYVEVDGSASIFSFGSAASVFGPWGGSDDNGVSYSSLSIDF